jgi:hypothetical protein
MAPLKRVLCAWCICFPVSAFVSIAPPAMPIMARRRPARRVSEMVFHGMVRFRREPLLVCEPLLPQRPTRGEVLKTSASRLVAVKQPRRWPPAGAQLPTILVQSLVHVLAGRRGDASERSLHLRGLLIDCKIPLISR